MTELKPCPFCGEHLIADEDEDTDGKFIMWVHDENSECFGKLYPVTEDDVEGWNRRTATAGPPREQNGARPLPFGRDELGRMVREAWVRWAAEQPNPKPSWLVPYGQLAESDKEADRQIGETIARWTLIGDVATAAPKGQAAEVERLREALDQIAVAAERQASHAKDDKEGHTWEQRHGVWSTCERIARAALAASKED